MKTQLFIRILTMALLGNSPMIGPKAQASEGNVIHGRQQEIQNPGTEVWEGSGALFTLHGQPQGTYSLKVTNTKSAGQTQSDIEVTLEDGTLLHQSCLLTETKPGSWASQCSHGSGGGHCFGEGLCISYEEDGKGREFATTIVKDGASQLRLLRTELQNAQAVRFFREKLIKK